MANTYQSAACLNALLFVIVIRLDKENRFHQDANLRGIT